MIELLALLLQIVGAVFLFAAGLGLVRFRDPLQRMHAATKAGTVGASFMVVAAMLTIGALDAVLIGLAVLVFLILTIPIAGHLLGRAAYVSGARLHGLENRDALADVLDREDRALDDRLARGEVSEG